MIYPLTSFKHLITALLILTSIEALAVCKLEDTPLTNESKCDEFAKLDHALNKNYKQLMNRLDQQSRETLRTVQRNWIRWRDEKCDEVQEASGCNQNGSCNGVAHDICIIDLTEQRRHELAGFSSDIPGARERKFSFSTDLK